MISLAVIYYWAIRHFCLIVTKYYYMLKPKLMICWDAMLLKLLALGWCGERCRKRIEACLCRKRIKADTGKQELVEEPIVIPETVEDVPAPPVQIEVPEPIPVVVEEEKETEPSGNTDGFSANYLIVQHLNANRKQRMPRKNQKQVLEDPKKAQHLNMSRIDENVEDENVDSSHPPSQPPSARGDIRGLQPINGAADANRADKHSHHHGDAKR